IKPSYMETALTEIRNQQQTTWNTFSPGWKKWDENTMSFLQPMGDAIVSALEIKEKDRVLDIASGTGEPGLTIAGIAKNGSVTALDISDKMLQTAKEKAAQKGIQNFTTQQGDACEIPFENESFDKVSCRMGFMFFPDMQLAANEMFRVLKQGGKIAVSVWYSPQKNFWIGSVMSVINKNIPTPAPPAGAPGMFRCAQPGLMKSIFQNAGFGNVKEEEISGKNRYDDFDDMWMQMNDIAAPVVNAMSRSDDTTKQKIKTELEQMATPHLTDKGLLLDFSALVISATK
ncbi:MAG: class I SAM-dependent methyltransferase, partial [Bacteroidota bacterium]|nr:class I SAM-dependent methyltransferase [Bacteroidota bacterium]